MSCIQMGGNLVTIRNFADNEAVRNFALGIIFPLFYYYSFSKIMCVVPFGLDTTTQAHGRMELILLSPISHQVNVFGFFLND